ncbi:tail fiber domain-containing protein [Salmonella enterica subsp. enterica serovar Sundsvall]|nr:tail fiber domain-containing protein [Salmonella enterica subsp. enterica serovar Sundsvall]
MSAGTLSLTNSSQDVGGTGTAFTTELSAGDFIVVTVGGVPYTLPVLKVNSNTSLTLVSYFPGPTQSGAAWSAVPRVALNMVTAALVAQSAEALRGLNYDKQNWQQVFSGNGTITVRLPDGSSWTGPAWNSITTTLDGKLDKKQNLSDLDDKSKSRTNLALGNTDDVTFGRVTAAATKGFSVPDSGDRNSITLTNRQASDGSFVNQLDMCWYDDYLNFGIVRSGNTQMSRVQMNVVTKGSGGSSFMWYPNGTYSAGRLVVNTTMQVGWDDPNNFGNAYIWANTASANDGGWVPALSWGTQSTGGYPIRATWGLISQGSSQWPTCDLRLRGDGQMFCNFRFNPTGADITTWASTGNFIFQKSASSDRDIKHSIVYGDGESSVENIRKLKPSTFIYNGDEQERVRRGFIAQDLLKIDSDYVKLITMPPQEAENGRDDQLAVDLNPLLMDVAITVKFLLDKIDGMQKQLDRLSGS